MLNKTTLLLAAVVALSGCQATQRQNATTGETETNATTKGALLGALAGAAVGLATGDDAKERRKHALIGAAGGAAVGGGIGYYFDQQEAELRKALLDSGVQVVRVGENQLMLRMENGIGFTSNSYQLDSYIHKTLRGVARILVEYPDTSLVIEAIPIAQAVIPPTKCFLRSVPSQCVHSCYLKGLQRGVQLLVVMVSVSLYAQITPQKDALVTAASRFKFCHSNSV